jgi:glycosyltransferase involved in cell wall biosynthesis
MKSALPKVSIIVPVWNVEKYLSACLDSLARQTYNNIEIICVNDASPDKCGEILSRYAVKDERIRILTHAENTGLSAARNTGLESCSGEYVCFVDSDDWIADDRIEIMVKALIDNDLDVVYNDALVEVAGSIEQPHWSIGHLKTEGFISTQFSAWMVQPYMFKKTFLVSVLPRPLFPVGLKHEDTYFYHTVIRAMNTVYAVTRGKYYYRRDNPNSIMFDVVHNNVKDFDIIEIMRLIFLHYRNNPVGGKVAVPLPEVYRYLSCTIDTGEYLRRLRSLYMEMYPFLQSNADLYTKTDLDFCRLLLNTPAGDSELKAKLLNILHGANRKKDLAGKLRFSLLQNRIKADKDKKYGENI